MPRPPGAKAREIAPKIVASGSAKGIVSLDAPNRGEDSGYEPGSPQYEWLAAGLAVSRARCTIVHMREPRYDWHPRQKDSPLTAQISRSSSQLRDDTSAAHAQPEISDRVRIAQLGNTGGNWISIQSIQGGGAAWPRTAVEG